MAISLTITDNLDGTGGVATITGSNPASTNTLYSAPFPGIGDKTMVEQVWTLVGTRTGDGTIPIPSATVPLGYYLWRNDNFLSPVTQINTFYQNLSDATTR